MTQPQDLLVRLVSSLIPSKLARSSHTQLARSSHTEHMELPEKLTAKKKKIWIISDLNLSPLQNQTPM